MNDLTGKVALVTGASRGIGKATALALAQAGASVFLAADGTAAELSAVKSECEAMRPGNRAAFGEYDVGDPLRVQVMVDDTLGAFGRIDVLVNNAGIRIRKPFGEFTAADFDQLMAVNLRAAFLASQAVLPAMRAQGGGRIIHVASQMGMVAIANSALYGLAKAGLIYLAKAMAVELAPENISVNAISPGPIETEFTRRQMEIHPGYREKREALVPMGRWGTPEEVAETILILASTRASFITGSNVVIDGGYVAH